jgi:gliding motility-associated-like protein
MNIPLTIRYLDNDKNPYGDLLNTIVCKEAEHGTVKFLEDSSLVYTPETGYQGPDRILYRLHNPSKSLSSDTASIFILVGPEIPLVIHNVITPNGDGFNDRWVIEGIEKYPDNDVTLFNRWGDKIRSFTGYDNSNVVWDGSNRHGEPLPDGTYFYILHVNNIGKFNGWIYVRANSR